VEAAVTWGWSRLNTILLLIVLLALIAVLARSAYGGPLDPNGAPASTDSVKLPGTPISSAPFVITGSGHYYLTRDLTYNGSDAAISFGAHVDHATLDLNGFTIYGSFQGTGIKALGPTPPSQYPLMITNGYVRTFATGVDVSGAAAVRIDGVHVFESTGNGFALGNHDVVTNCTAQNNDGHGIRIIGSLSSVHDCMVVDNAQDGIRVEGIGNVVEDSQVLRNTGVGIHFSTGTNSIARGNDLPIGPGVSIHLALANVQNVVHENVTCSITGQGTGNFIVSNMAVC
jgi:hypothetical protein